MHHLILVEAVQTKVFQVLLKRGACVEHAKLDGLSKEGEGPHRLDQKLQG